MPRSQGVQNNQAGPITRFIFFLAKRFLGRVPLGTRIRDMPFTREKIEAALLK